MVLLPYQIQGQCTRQVFHSSGTIAVGCTNVTVTSDGSTGVLDFCPADCRILTVNLVGTPPFTLSGTILNNGSPVGTFTQNYNSLTGTLQICAPVGVSPGSLVVQATSLVDAWCGCLI